MTRRITELRSYRVLYHYISKWILLNGIDSVWWLSICVLDWIYLFICGLEYDALSSYSWTPSWLQLFFVLFCFQQGHDHQLLLLLLLLLLQISRLIYTNSGNAILALASNAIHLLWKWQRSDRNASGKVKALAKRF